jgi:hypothetical protein
MDRVLRAYEQSHNLHALQVATGSCQVRFEEQSGEDYAGAEPPVPLPAYPRMGGQRNIGCGWWPIGRNADRDCAAGVAASDDRKRRTPPNRELDGPRFATRHSSRRENAPMVDAFAPPVVFRNVSRCTSWSL